MLDRHHSLQLGPGKAKGAFPDNYAGREEWPETLEFDDGIMLNDKQVVVAPYEQDPFGNPLSQSGPLGATGSTSVLLAGSAKGFLGKYSCGLMVAVPIALAAGETANQDVGPQGADGKYKIAQSQVVPMPFAEGLF